jgi:glycerol-3-phosphate dehydrogenase (NAD(P)+)
LPAVSDLVAIVGTGQMGLVLAESLASQGVRVRFWGRDRAAAETLARTRRSPARLPGLALPGSVEVTGRDEGLFDGATLAVSAVPTQFIAAIWGRLRRVLPERLAVVSVAKGIENGSLRRPTEAIAAAAGDETRAPRRALCALSGPTIAAELGRHLPATMVAASPDESLGRLVQRLFGSPWLRVYRNDDLVGVEVAGAAKNVIALAAGMVDGLGAGYNAKSALLARGLAEIARLGASMGARIDTFFGVAGVGDLATTCFCPEGRNRTCGERLGRGETLQRILSETASVVEGVPTTRSLVQLARAQGVDMPITTAVHAILFEGLGLRDAIAGLMAREPKAE